MKKLQSFLSLATSLIVILLLLTACNTPVDSSNVPDIPDEQPTMDNNPIVSEDENTPADADKAETNEFAYETEPLPEDLEVRYCVNNVLTFTSLTDMNQQISAIQEISPSDSSYNQYQAANATSVASYLIPVFNFPNDFPEYELVQINMHPYLVVYYFERETDRGFEKFTVSIARIEEDDPIRDKEIGSGIRRDENGYWHDVRLHHILYVPEENRSVAIAYPVSWVDEYGLTYINIIDMLTIRTVTVNPDHVTE